MPGPISDSYDPEFSTGENAGIVRDAITEQRDRFSTLLGEQLLYIVDVAEDDFKHTLHKYFSCQLTFNERELRIIRFALNRAKESI
jgi:hypothetical protein